MKIFEVLLDRMTTTPTRAMASTPIVTVFDSQCQAARFVESVIVAVEPSINHVSDTYLYTSVMLLRHGDVVDADALIFKDALCDRMRMQKFSRHLENSALIAESMFLNMSCGDVPVDEARLLAIRPLGAKSFVPVVKVTSSLKHHCVDMHADVLPWISTATYIVTQSPRDMKWEPLDDQSPPSMIKLLF